MKRVVASTHPAPRVIEPKAPDRRKIMHIIKMSGCDIPWINASIFSLCFPLRNMKARRRVGIMATVGGTWAKGSFMFCRWATNPDPRKRNKKRRRGRRVRNMVAIVSKERKIKTLVVT